MEAATFNKFPQGEVRAQRRSDSVQVPWGSAPLQSSGTRKLWRVDGLLGRSGLSIARSLDRRVAWSPSRLVAQSLDPSSLGRLAARQLDRSETRGRSVAKALDRSLKVAAGKDRPAYPLVITDEPIVRPAYPCRPPKQFNQICMRPVRGNSNADFSNAGMRLTSRTDALIIHRNTHSLS